MSARSKKLRARARRVLAAVGLEARPLLRVFDRWDAEAITLGETSLRCGAEASEVPGALDAVRRLRPRAKFDEVRYWFNRPIDTSQKIRILDDAPINFREHRIEQGTRAVVLGTKFHARDLCSAHVAADPGPTHGAGPE